MQTPGAENTPRERDGLFDIVRWDYGERFSDEPQCGTRLSRPHPEERACSNGSAKSNGRARVWKDEDGHGGGSHASRRVAAQPVCRDTCAPSRCDAPQHEDAADFGQTKPTWRKDQPPAAGNDRWLRSIVSGLLFTMDGATSTCRAVSARSANGPVARAARAQASSSRCTGLRPRPTADFAITVFAARCRIRMAATAD